MTIPIASVPWVSLSQYTFIFFLKKNSSFLYNTAVIAVYYIFQILKLINNIRLLYYYFLYDVTLIIIIQTRNHEREEHEKKGALYLHFLLSVFHTK